MKRFDLSDRDNLSHIAAVPDKMTACCGRCGCNWEYRRHESLMCPFCAATFAYAYMNTVAPSYIQLEPT